MNSEPNQATELAQPSQVTVVKPKFSPKYASEHFRYKGRDFRVFKRSTELRASWYILLQRHRTRLLMSLGTDSVAHAVREAKVKIDLWDDQREAELRSSMKRPATDNRFTPMGVMLAAAPGVLIGVQPYVRMQYVRSLRWVLVRALGLPANNGAVDALSCGVLTAATAEKYFEWLLREADKIENQTEKNRCLLTGRQMFTFARSLLQPRVVKGLRGLGVHLPEVEGFRNELKIARIRVASSKVFQCPDDALVRRTFIEWIRIARTQNYELVGQTNRHGPLHEIARRNLFIDVGLELSCGLRAGDVRQVRWDWFQTHQGQPRLCSNDINDKGKVGSINIRPLHPFWKILNFWIDKNGWRGAPGELVLSVRPRERAAHPRLSFHRGGHCDRDVTPFIHCSLWMRWLGWKTTRTGHALRDLSASLVTRKYGLHAAKLFCRHKKISTTESHYNSFVSDVDDLDPKRSAWYRWAK